MIDAEYVLPLRWSDDAGLGELAAYLRRIAAVIDVTVVDGSDRERFAAHAAALPPGVRHVPVAPWPGRNGKVAGVMTGVRLARHERVVLADDDVRYDVPGLERVVALLGTADVVAPQNHFAPLPWHARWDTARILLNRAVGHDYPGTLGVRRAALAEHGYDGDVLFENLELIRTVRAAGGTFAAAPDCFVVRRPPTPRHFLGQRVRQAYDSLAQPGRLAAELAILPLALAFAVRSPRRLLALAGAAVAVAELGRRRAGGRRVFPTSSALWAPLWLLERGACSWVALALRLRGGVRYSDGRLRRAGTPLRVLRARRAAGGAAAQASPESARKPLNETTGTGRVGA
jgi:hypothetical protein